MESTELLTILEQLERDKGIDKKILIEAVESAVATAAKKLWTVDKNEEVRAVLDIKTGKITAYAGTQEIRSSEFGRIAAQTAKQVVIQKIREAEKDVVFNEYQVRIGEIISGGVYRFERGNIIVDLGKAEAYIPKKNNLPKKSSAREIVSGPTCWTSNATAKVPRSFYPGPIRTLSGNFSSWKSPRSLRGSLRSNRSPVMWENAPRSPFAPRTKRSIASVPAWGCAVHASRTSFRNYRVRRSTSSVILPTSRNISRRPLSPAEISQIQLNYDGKKANIIVADDQLSLAIGKHGQNVRLASQLVSWELDLFSSDQWKQLKEQAGVEETAQAAEDEKKKTTEQQSSDRGLTVLTGVGEKIMVQLKAAGLDTLEKIVAADVETLTKIKGLGEVKAKENYQGRQITSQFLKEGRKGIDVYEGIGISQRT